VIPPRSSRGFTLVELLVALGIVMAIGGALAQVVQPARAAFDRVPAELELDQRGWAAIDALSHAVRSAVRYALSTGPSLTVMVAVVNGAQGILEVDLPSPDAPLTMATTPCPNIKEVCGFTPGTTALVADASGQYEIFTVASTAPGARALTPDRVLARAYPAGSVVTEIEQYSFSVASQSDGTLSLIRHTAAGATQPMVDFIRSLSFSASDQQIDIAVTVQAPTTSMRRVIADRLFTTSIRLRNGS
jgi:Tfp pilus assembly protein PilW